MSDTRLSNLGKDLRKAKQQALLIEVLRSDLDSWVDHCPDIFRVVCDASASIYDVGVKEGKTNVLVVGEAEGREPLSIFGSLLGSLDNEFDDLHKREILAKLAGFGLNQALGGVVGEAVGDNLSVGVEKMMDYLAEWRSSGPDFLTSFFEAGVEAVADESGGIVGSIGGTGADAIAGQFSSEASIYLSREARKRLKELKPHLSEEATSHETLQLALEMLLVTAKDSPKVIVVKDPLRLDDASLALLAMLVSLEKDLRQLNPTEGQEQSEAQTAGISVVLTFTGAQPHDTLQNKDTAEKQQAISRLRMMASRYSLLERLDSDIPVPAVLARNFVGREEELKSLWKHWIGLCDQPDDSAEQTWCLIKGEPGTGKTALANRFMQQIRSDIHNPAGLSIPALRMLNQTGHSAQATGLASLKNSIVEEIRRLTMVYEENVGWFARFGQEVTEGSLRWKKDATSDDPEAKKRTRGRVGKMIARLVGADAAVSIARSAKDWSKQDEMHSIRQQEFGQSCQANHKDEQFELLQEALYEIRKLASKCTPSSEKQPPKSTSPLLLLIDDLQWVDDFTAEFLLNEWPTDIPVYIVATARGSDSFSNTGDSSAHQAMNRHRNRLFVELGLVDNGPIVADREGIEEQEEKQKRKTSLAGSLELKGMDQPMLANLIKDTYAGITQEQAEQFAVGVIKNLSVDNSRLHVITLFAIETLNVLSDPEFYRRNAELLRMIEPLPGTDRYRFEAPENVSLTDALDKIFKKLTSIYQTSYLIEAGQGPDAARFNLASYAILEERLHLIEQYFGDHGGTARYSLLFSALLGSPFHRGLVQHVIEGLKRLAPEEYPELANVIRELKDKSGGSFGVAEYELLERAYELIRRLEENSSQADRYMHQHSLLQQFLLGQFTQLMNRLYPDLYALEEGIRHLVNQVKNLGHDWFDDLALAEGHELSINEPIEIANFQFLVAIYGYWYRLMKTRVSRIGDWGRQYLGRLNQLAAILDKWGHPKEALVLYQEALSISSQGYEASPDGWKEDHARALYNLGESQLSFDRLEEAQPLLEKAESIMREGYESASEHWGLDYANTLSALLQTKNEPLLLEKAESILREGYESSTEQSAKEDYAIGLYKFCFALRKWGNMMEPVVLKEMVLPTFGEGYDISPEHWGELYANALSRMAEILLSEDMRYGNDMPAKDAVQKGEEARSSYDDMLFGEGKMDDTRRSELVDDMLEGGILDDLLAGGLEEREEARPLLEKAVKIMREGYQSSPKRWADKLARSLMILAKFHDTDIFLSLSKETERLTEEALSIMRQGYESSPERWAQEFASGLEAWSHNLHRRDRFEEALTKQEEAVSVWRERHEAFPNRRMPDYDFALNFLSLILETDKRLDASLEVHRELSSYLRKRYEADDEGAQRPYVMQLLTVARTLADLNRSEDAVQSYGEALSISRQSYQSDGSEWEEVYFTAFKNLLEHLEQNGLAEEARPLKGELKRLKK